MRPIFIIIPLIIISIRMIGKGGKGENVNIAARSPVCVALMDKHNNWNKNKILIKNEEEEYEEKNTRHFDHHYHDLRAISSG